jgi:FkbM family methyltransferase
MTGVAARLKQSVRFMVPVKAWNLLRLVRIQYTRTMRPKHFEQHTFSGFPLTVEIGDPIAQAWYGADSPLLPEVEFLREHRLRTGAKVFDIGAHQAVVAMVLARTVEPGRVVAVEGNGYNAAVGQRNAQRNHVDNLCVLHGVGGSTSGQAIFSENWNGEVNHGSPDVGKVKVRCYTIDELSELHGLPEVMFIDVEGYEREVLIGAQKTLSSRPDCMIEVHVGKIEKYGASAESILEFFPWNEYQMFVRLDEEHDVFREIHQGSALPPCRFFLLAIARQHHAAQSVN